MADWYVDPGVVGGAGDGTNWTNAYSALQTAVAAKAADLTEVCIFHCRSSGASPADTTHVVVNGYTTYSDGRHIEIVVDEADRHAGKWNTSKYRIEAATDGTNTALMTIREDYVRVKGLQFHKTGSTAHLQQTIYVYGQNAGNRVDISDCIVYCQNDATYREIGINLYDAELVANLWNNAIYGTGSVSNSLASAILVGIINTANIYHCTVQGGYHGIAVSATSGTVNIQDCYIAETGGGSCLPASGGATVNLTRAATSDATGSASYQNIDYSTSSGAYLTNVTGGSEDFHISTSSSLYDAGDAPGGSAPLNYTTDIDHATVATWCIGCDSYPAAAAQYARPTSTVAAGNWTYTGAASLHAALSETSASDTEYDTSGAAPSNDTMTLALTSIAAPTSGTVTLRVRARY